MEEDFMFIFRLTAALNCKYHHNVNGAVSKIIKRMAAVL